MRISDWSSDVCSSDLMGALAVTGASARFAAAPYVEVPASGAGDVFAAIFLARWLEKRDAVRVLSLAVSSSHAVIAATAAAGADELALVAHQDMLPDPSARKSGG